MKFWRRLTSVGRRKRFEAEMAEEMRLHLELQAERNRAAGMSAEEAGYAAQRQFGNVGSLQERVREAKGWLGRENLRKDVQLAARRLAKTPAFSALAVITLAVGIGFVTAVFSLLDAMWLRPLPFADAPALVHLRRSTPQNADGAFTPTDYLELKRNEASFGIFAGYVGLEVSLAEPGPPAELVGAMRVAADYFNVLGMSAEMGRTFLPDEEVHGRHRVVVISHAFWQGRFGGAADVLGRTVRVDGEAREIVGVLPKWDGDLRLNRETGLFLPLAFTEQERGSRTEAWVNILGRRADNLSEAQGRQWVSALGQRLMAESPAENAGGEWRCLPLAEALGNPTGRMIVTMLLGLAGCVLLIACSNLANLLLARTIGRAHELGVRAALGASRLQLIRPLVVEALLLSLTGGALALPVSLAALRWLSDQSLANGGPPMSPPLDGRVLSFALGTSVFTALFFAVAPALFAVRVDVNDALKRGARGTTASRTQHRWRQLLIIGQFAMAMILVTGAGLLARGADNFIRLRAGWDSGAIAQGYVELPKASYPGAEDIRAFDRQLLERIARLPGVEAASLSYGLPFDGPFGPRPYLVEGREPPVKGQEPVATYNGVTADYFAVTRIRLLQGRAFNAQDTAVSPRVVIISESMARSLFPKESAIGRRLAVAGADKTEWAEIVGVVADVRSFSVYQPSIPFQTYHPLTEEPWLRVRFAVRATGVPAETLLAALGTTLAGLSPELPVRELMTADGSIERYAFDLTLLRNILGAFALVGVGLAATGIFGVIARNVAQRRGEIGIRMALGANVRDIVSMILRSGLRLTTIGGLLGVLGAIALSHLVAMIMPELQTNGTVVLGAALLLLTLVALVACYLPARAAAKIDPVIALRSE